jgi:hypothetical protein
MAVKNLNSLVLVGSTVLWGGKAGNPRLGASSSAYGETPEIRTSMRHPSRNVGQEFQPAPRPGHADYFRVDTVAVAGAGRSLCCAGVLGRSCLFWSTGSAAALSTRAKTAAITVVTRCRTGLAWCKPANPMSPASTWGFGVR